MADPDAAWSFDDMDNSNAESSGGADGETGAGASEGSYSSIPTGPPVPNPYAHLLPIPCKSREYTHWARSKHLQYKYLNEYLHIYYDDYIDYMDKRKHGIRRDVPRAHEWGERALRLYTVDGRRLSQNDVKYWYTTKNQVKPTYSIFHAVHSKDYYTRQYRDIMI